MSASMFRNSKQCAAGTKLDAAIRIVKSHRVERKPGRRHAFSRPAGDAGCFQAVNRAVGLVHARAAAFVHQPIHLTEVDSDGCQ